MEEPMSDGNFNFEDVDEYHINNSLHDFVIKNDSRHYEV